jgi:hypothetical protein
MPVLNSATRDYALRTTPVLCATASRDSSTLGAACRHACFSSRDVVRRVRRRARGHSWAVGGCAYAGTPAVDSLASRKRSSMRPR